MVTEADARLAMSRVCAALRGCHSQEWDAVDRQGRKCLVFDSGGLGITFCSGDTWAECARAFIRLRGSSYFGATRDRARWFNGASSVEELVLLAFAEGGGE